MEQHTDLKSRLKALSQPTQNKVSDQGVMTLSKSLEFAIQDAIQREKFLNETLYPVISKLVRTPDIGTLRMTTISDRVGELRNTDTPFLNILESNGLARSFDYQYSFNEWDIGEDVAELWNIEDALPSEAKSVRPRRSNTITCVGNKINVSLMVENMAQQQANINFMARELDMQITRIRRKMNSALLSNTEVKAEAEGSVPQLGGFVTRSTLYNVSISNADLSRPVIQTQIDSMANPTDPQGRGYNRPLLGLCQPDQLQVIRDIILTEYSGIDPMSRMDFEDTLKRRLRDYRVPVQTVFEPLPGPVIPFVYDAQLPANTCIIFEPDQPRLVKMFLGDMEGPYAMTRPTEKLQRLDVVFDLFSLEDPLVESRSVLTNVGAA